MVNQKQTAIWANILVAFSKHSQLTQGNWRLLGGNPNYYIPDKRNPCHSTAILLEVFPGGPWFLSILIGSMCIYLHVIYIFDKCIGSDTKRKMHPWKQQKMTPLETSETCETTQTGLGKLKTERLV